MASFWGEVVPQHVAFINNPNSTLGNLNLSRAIVFWIISGITDLSPTTVAQTQTIHKFLNSGGEGEAVREALHY